MGSGYSNVRENKKKIKPLVSFYSLKAIQGNGKEMLFESIRGRKVLLVNTASDCGYTAQLDELQQLYHQYHDRLVVIAFPSNDFKEQEKGNDEEVSYFCKINYGITFPIMQKSIVLKSEQQNEVYAWLTTKEKNGWNEQEPEWNFCKYLVDEEGVLLSYFPPAVSP